MGAAHNPATLQHIMRQNKQFQIGMFPKTQDPKDIASIINIFTAYFLEQIDGQKTNGSSEKEI